MAAKPRAKPDPIAQNGQPQTFTLEFQGEEVNLIHQVFVQASFPSAYAKQVAASVQAKLEQVVNAE